MKQKQLPQQEISDEIIFGRNSVMEALKSGRSINKILLAKGEKQGSIKEVIGLAKEKRIILQEVEINKLDMIVKGLKHQGVIAYGAPVDYVEIEDILQRASDLGQPPFIVLLDELEDPHNLGAILRTADAAGVHGVLIPKRRSCPLSATVAKTSAGAVEYVPVARIGNIAQTIKELKKMGMWVVGADMDGEKNYYEADLTGALVLIIGGEGKGISRLTKEQCDFLVKIPMSGKINSLNASVAGSVLMFESLKQRMLKVNK
ncbi:23S rRNA (guanosine(2251)-2'-O)-methyltransferase RlmB [Anaerosinus massiliensis]|uniref:23S rRNA (guanosine(2251)-2'-O)-methyltransferase RlmB n=1 Tax=Massilibacillus massiliensis TaxID=1806837 RepID=UPI000AE55E85|nr:23S rRNA (guanosine(2251)-2'-O)-methyltransferase RlmB [Massilibacillus massiliensis]